MVLEWCGVEWSGVVAGRNESERSPSVRVMDSLHEISQLKEPWLREELNLEILRTR